MRSLLSLVAFALLGACQNPSAEGLTYADVHGERVDPMACAAGEVVALIFVTTDCPIANGYAPQLKKMFADYVEKPVHFYLVHVDPMLTAEKAREHAKDYGYEGAVLLDPTHGLVARAGVRVTPEAAVFDANGDLQYRGRINNWYGDIGRKRFNVSKHDLRDAIDAVLAGATVKAPRTKAVGCEIEPLN